jgi:hypothetical protein
MVEPDHVGLDHRGVRLYHRDRVLRNFGQAGQEPVLPELLQRPDHRRRDLGCYHDRVQALGHRDATGQLYLCTDAGCYREIRRNRRPYGSGQVMTIEPGAARVGGPSC